MDECLDFSKFLFSFFHCYFFLYLIFIIKTKFQTQTNTIFLSKVVSIWYWSKFISRIFRFQIDPNLYFIVECFECIKFARIILCITLVIFSFMYFQSLDLKNTNQSDLQKRILIHTHTHTHTIIIPRDNMEERKFRKFQSSIYVRTIIEVKRSINTLNRYCNSRGINLKKEFKIIEIQ